MEYAPKFVYYEQDVVIVDVYMVVEYWCCGTA